MKKIAQRMALDWESAAKDKRSGVLTTERARGYLNSLLASTGQSLLDAVSVKQFAELWLAGKKSERSSGTHERYEHTVNSFLEHLGKGAAMPLSGVTALHVDAFKGSRLKVGLAPQSVNLQLKILRAFFAAGHRKGLTERNPAAAVEFLDAGEAIREPFTSAEIHAILREARGTEWETSTLFGYYCGMRLGDACQRSWDEIDLAAGTVSWSPEKTKRKNKRMVLPLAPLLLERLLALAGNDDPKGLITPTLAKGKPSGRSGLSQQFGRLMVKAGVHSEIHAAKSEGQGRARTAKSFHSLRHALNTHLMQAGVDEAVRVLVSGHSDARTNRKYSHVQVDSFRDAFAKLPVNDGS